jgi:hypothetical protein
LHKDNQSFAQEQSSFAQKQSSFEHNNKKLTGRKVLTRRKGGEA